MALIKCPECGNTISDKAKSCPHCGVDPNLAPEPKPVETTPRQQVPSEPQKRNRKTLWMILVPLILIGIGVAIWIPESPKNEKVVEDFAFRFGNFANNNQRDSIMKYYPGFELSDSIIAIPVTDLKVTTDEGKNVYSIEYSPEIYIKVENKEGEIHVLESKGLIAYPQDRIETAKQTGLWSDNLNDVELKQRMNDEGFFEYLDNLVTQQKSQILTVSTLKGSDPDFYYTITNNTDQEIKSSDYQQNWESMRTIYEEGLANLDMKTKTSKHTKPGKPIEPHGSVKIIQEMGGSSFSDDFKGITLTMSDNEFRERFFKYTGNEYRDYLDNKK